MKKLAITGIVLLTVFLIFFFSPQKKDGTIHYKLNNMMYKLYVADEPEEHTQGLMNKRSLDASGMIFVFPDKQQRTFWNQNTYLDLDVYWIADDRVIGKSFLPSIEKSREVVTVTSPVPVDKVVELVK